MKKSFVRGPRAQTRAYSPAVLTEGGKTVWLAGHTGAVDDAGKSLAGDFDAQCRQTFRNIEKTLAEAGAKLADLVTMTVFLIDARLHHAHDRIAHRDFRQGFSGERRDHRRRLRPAGNDDRDSGRRGYRCLTRHSGAERSEEPGIHNHGQRIWIPDLPLRGNPE